MNQSDVTESQFSDVIMVTLELFDNYTAEYLNPDTPIKVIPTWIYILLVLVGIIGNVASTVVFTRPSMSTPINYLLASFEGINTIHVILFIPLILKLYWGYFNLTLANAIIQVIYVYMETWVVCVSNWLTVTIGVFRLIAVGWPLKADIFCSKKRAIIAIWSVSVSSAILAVPFGLIGSYEEYSFLLIDQESEIRKIYLPIASQYVAINNGTLVEACHGLTLLTTSVPCFTLAFVTFLLLRYLWLARTNRRNLHKDEPAGRHREISTNFNEMRISITLLVILVMFFFAYLPDSIANVLLFIIGQQRLNQTTVDVIAKTKICILISNAFTFFFYYMMSERFRITFRQVFGKIWPRKISTNVSLDTKLSSMN